MTPFLRKDEKNALLISFNQALLVHALPSSGWEGLVSESLERLTGKVGAWTEEGEKGQLIEVKKEETDSGEPGETARRCQLALNPAAPRWQKSGWCFLGLFCF